MIGDKLNHFEITAKLGEGRVEDRVLQVNLMLLVAPSLARVADEPRLADLVLQLPIRFHDGRFTA